MASESKADYLGLDELIAMHQKYSDALHDGTWQQRELMAFQELKWLRAELERLEVEFGAKPTEPPCES